MKTVWTIENIPLHFGGPFSRTRHMARISVELLPEQAFSSNRPWNSTETQIKEFARNCWRHFADAEDYKWPDTKLISLDNIADGVWEIVIEDAYLD